MTCVEILEEVATKSMQIAVWNLPPADLLVSGLTSGAFRDRVEIHRTARSECERLLREGAVDAALLPTMTVIHESEDLEVLPAVALSSWSYPFARLVLDHELDEPIRNVAYDPRYEQERFITDIVLREHYKMEADFVAYPNAEIDDLLASDEDAHLIVGADVPALSAGALAFDVGREWYELANYPMVWGLFAALKERAHPGIIRTVRDGVRASEKQRPVWIRAQESSAALHEFYRDELRLRLDDLAVASLTEFKKYLFFYDVTDEVGDIPFAFLPEEEDEEGRKPLI